MTTLSAMKASRRWLLWRHEAPEKPGGKPKKMPYYVNGGQRGNGIKLDSEEDRAQLATYEDAVAKVAELGNGWGIGFALGPDGTGNCWQGIDLDHLTDHPENTDLVETLPGYAERSPGGDGVHFIGYGKQFKSIKRNNAGFEAYASGRFFTFTENSQRDQPMCDLSELVNGTLRQRFTKASESTPAAPEGEQASGTDPLTLAGILARIPIKGIEYESDDARKPNWLGVLQGVHDEFAGTHQEDAAIAVVDLWSRGTDPEPDPNYQPGLVAKKWRTFTKEGGITIGHVRMMAGLPRVDVSGLFPPVEQSEQSKEDELWPWEEPVDIYDEATTVPPYPGKLLPEVYEAFMETNYRFHHKSSREPYAGLFDLAVSVHLRPSVRVEEVPGSGRNKGFMYSLNEQSAIVGGSTKAKTGTLMHAVGHELEGSGGELTSWNALEQARVLKRRNVEEENIRKRFKGSEAAIEKEIAKLRKEIEAPEIVNSKFTDKIMVKRCAVNGNLDLPTNDIVDEWDNVFGGAAYRSDGGNAMTDLWRKAFDNRPYSDESMNAGRLESKRMAANLGYDCTPADMSAWFGYDRAMQNGTMARQSLFVPGKTWTGDREPINWMVVQAWRDVQEKLHGLQNLDLYLEEDPEFDRAINEEIDIYSQMSDSGNYVETWLVKSKIRVARCAARRYLVEELAAGRVPETSAVIPRRYRRWAWEFLTQFAWPHQVHAHRTLIAGESYKGSLAAVMRRAYVNQKSVFTSDELVDSKRPKGVRRDDDGFIKVLMFGYRWIRPKITRKFFNPNQPWTAGQFEVNPKLLEIGKKYHDRIHREHEVNLGIIRSFIEKNK
jgi:hypothetical protein